MDAKSSGASAGSPKTDATVVIGPEEQAIAKKDAKPGEAEEVEAKGNMWGDEIGDAFGAGGLGLSGIGEGGGGRGEEGIGLGTVGGFGHGAGTGTGQGFGSGAGRLGGSGSSKKPSVNAATATTAGAGLPAEVIQRVVRSNLSRITQCYEKAMTKNSGLAGKLSVKFIVNGQGAVSTVAAEDVNMPDADLVSCVLGVVKTLSFPAPDGGSPVVVSYPFQFSPGDP